MCGCTSQAAVPDDPEAVEPCSHSSESSRNCAHGARYSSAVHKRQARACAHVGDVKVRVARGEVRVVDGRRLRDDFGAARVEMAQIEGETLQFVCLEVEVVLDHLSNSTRERVAVAPSSAVEVYSSKAMRAGRGVSGRAYEVMRRAGSAPQAEV